jgi:hypothetical protein
MLFGSGLLGVHLELDDGTKNGDNNHTSKISVEHRVNFLDLAVLNLLDEEESGGETTSPEADSAADEVASHGGSRNNDGLDEQDETKDGEDNGHGDVDDPEERRAAIHVEPGLIDDDAQEEASPAGKDSGGKAGNFGEQEADSESKDNRKTEHEPSNPVFGV